MAGSGINIKAGSTYYDKPVKKGTKAYEAYKQSFIAIEEGFSIMQIKKDFYDKYSDLSNRMVRFVVEKANYELKKKLAKDRERIVELHIARYEDMFDKCMEFEAPKELPEHVQFNMKVDRFMTAGEMLRASEYLFGFHTKEFRERFRDDLINNHLEETKFIKYDFSKLKDKELIELLELMESGISDQSLAFKVDKSSLHEVDPGFDFDDNIKHSQEVEYKDADPNDIKHVGGEKEKEMIIIENKKVASFKKKGIDEVKESVHKSNRKVLIDALKKSNK